MNYPSDSENPKRKAPSLYISFSHPKNPQNIQEEESYASFVSTKKKKKKKVVWTTPHLMHMFLSSEDIYHIVGKFSWVNQSINQCSSIHPSINQSLNLNDPTQPPQYIPYSYFASSLYSSSSSSPPIPLLQRLRAQLQHPPRHPIGRVAVLLQHMNIICKGIDLEFERLRDIPDSSASGFQERGGRAADYGLEG